MEKERLRLLLPWEGTGGRDRAGQGWQWWLLVGPVRKVSSWRRRWHLMGQRISPGSNTQQGQRTDCCWLSLMDQGMCPLLRVSIVITQATSPGRVFWPFERPGLSSSPTLCVCLCELPVSLSLPTCSFSLPHCYLGASTTDHLDFCQWAALGLRSLNVQQGQVSRGAGNRTDSHQCWWIWLLSNAKSGSL